MDDIDVLETYFELHFLTYFIKLGLIKIQSIF